MPAAAPSRAAAPAPPSTVAPAARNAAAPEEPVTTTPSGAITLSSWTGPVPEEPPPPVTARPTLPATAPPAPSDASDELQVWVERPEPPAHLDARLILLHEPDSVRAASFRVLRDRIASRGDPHVIAVTSPESGDGKTTCAVNLALALGECGRATVLLLEANLRNPSLAQLFQFTPPACLTEQMEEHRKRPAEPWWVVEMHSQWLHVAAVKPGSGARPLLDLPAFSGAVKSFRSAGYDYLVVDTPPVLGSADVNLIEEIADGLLLVARSGKSNARALRKAVEQLDAGRLLGVTLLDVP
jgi:Mrp family chromosome partitioning ATPase